MNTASLENSKKLYEVSGWEDVEFEHTGYSEDGGVHNEVKWLHGMKYENAWGYDWSAPAYDAGYLLRKLPVFGHVAKLEDGKGYVAWSAEKEKVADTPEDALCLLAIKLFEEGVLTT